MQAQPFAVLECLLARPGELVTRDELRQLLWPNGTFVDFDKSLNTAVMKLREALGDSAQAPLFVETVGRHGYRFIAHAETQPPITPAPPSLSPETAPTRVSRRKAQQRYVSPVEFARLHTALGEKDPAFARLEEAYRTRAPRLHQLKTAWDFIPLRSDPRWSDLVHRLKLD